MWLTQPATIKVFPMDLKQIKGLGPSKQEKLKAAGVTTVDSLARADIAAVAAKSGLDAKLVKELKQKATGLVLVEDLKGIGPATLGTLSQASAESLRELYDAGADWLAAEVQLAQAKLAELQKQAEQLATRVAADAKTPAGRRALADDAREAAMDAAVKVEAAGRKVAAAAKDASVQLVAAARTAQERAPGLLAQAEATLKDAREKAQAAAKKAESVLKAEAQKAKATTERVVAQAQKRFTKAA
jgi:hypothetical protein